MSRVFTPPKDKLFDTLRRLDSRIAAVERRNLAAYISTAGAIALVGNAENEQFGDPFVDRAFSHILVPDMPRVAYLFEDGMCFGGVGTFRFVAVNDEHPYSANPDFILDEWTLTRTTLGYSRANVPIPEAVRDGRQWNFSLHGKINDESLGFWKSYAWGIVLTDDPSFVLDPGIPPGWSNRTPCA